MSIHINETTARHAVVACRNALARSQSAWLIWSVGDEGYKMAPSSSHEADSIRRYWPETVAGEFRYPVARTVLLANLSEARDRQAVRGDNRTAKRRAYEAQYKARQRAKAAA